MTDPASIAAGLGSLKTALEIAKTISDARDTTKLLSVKLELQGLLLQAQEAQAGLLEERRQLEERVRELEAWDRDRQRYQPETIGTNQSLCYGVKAEAKGADTDHKLCANCFEHGLKRYLQPHTIPEGRAEVLMCRECGDQILMRGVADTRALNISKPKPPTARAFGRGPRSSF